MKKNEHTLYCFTPLVTLATFVVEFVFGLYTLYKYRKTTFGKVAAFGLFGLATFQLAEWMVCGVTGNPDFWMRFGFVGTALLPAIGLNLVHLISNRKYKYLTQFGYLFAAVVSLMLIFQAGKDLYFACMGTFVAFQLGTLTDAVYLGYYVIILGFAIIILLRNIIAKKKHVQISILTLVLLLVFIVPTYVLYLFHVISGASVPSIMCGFAIIAAVILVAKILPKYENEYFAVDPNV